MRIGELAKAAGISVSSVRFYEAQGLMPKPETRESGYREYRQVDLARLRLIVAAKRQRFSLKLIRTCLDALDQEPQPCAEIAELVPAPASPLGGPTQGVGTGRAPERRVSLCDPGNRRTHKD
jgi:DNA-binding transcriptional MerR regulator